MEKIESRKFNSLKEWYANVDVFLSHTDEYTLISIPAWNWSYLWSVHIKDSLSKKECINALSDPMFPEAAEEFTEELYKYLLGVEK